MYETSWLASTIPARALSAVHGKRTGLGRRPNGSHSRPAICVSNGYRWRFTTLLGRWWWRPPSWLLWGCIIDLHIRRRSRQWTAVRSGRRGVIKVMSIAHRQRIMPRVITDFRSHTRTPFLRRRCNHRKATPALRGRPHRLCEPWQTCRTGVTWSPHRIQRRP